MLNEDTGISPGRKNRRDFVELGRRGREDEGSVGFGDILKETIGNAVTSGLGMNQIHQKNPRKLQG